MGNPVDFTIAAPQKSIKVSPATDFNLTRILAQFVTYGTRDALLGEPGKVAILTKTWQREPLTSNGQNWY